MSSNSSATARRAGPAQRADTRPRRAQQAKPREEPAPMGKAIALGLLGSAAIVLPAAAALTSTASAPAAAPASTTAHTTAQVTASNPKSSTQVQATLTADVTPVSSAGSGQSAAAAQSAQPSQPGTVSSQWTTATDPTGPSSLEGGQPTSAPSTPSGPVYYPSNGTPTSTPSTTNPATPPQFNPGGPNMPVGNNSGTSHDRQGTWNHDGWRSHRGHHKEHPVSTATHVSVPPMIASNSGGNWDSVSVPTTGGINPIPFETPAATGNTTTTGTSTTGTTGTTGTATTGTTTASTTTTGSASPVPVFDSNGFQVGTAVSNQQTGALQLQSTSGAVLGNIQQQNGMVNLVNSAGTVIGSFSYNQNAGQVQIGAPGTGTAVSGTTGTTTTGTTGIVTTAATTSATTTSATPVPVFDSSGIQIGVATLNQSTGATELVGFNNTVLGNLVQQNGAIYLVGSGNSVIGGLTVSPATGQWVLTTTTSTATGTGTAGSSATSTSGTVS